MLKVRTTKTASGNIAVQVVYRRDTKTKVVKHIGSARNSSELKNLLQLGRQYIHEKSPTIPLFPEVFKTEGQTNNLVSLDNLNVISVFHKFAYELFSRLYQYNGFTVLSNNLLRDLSIIRIIEPSSKLRSINLLDKYFGIKYTENILYKNLGKMTVLKDMAEKTAVEYARKNLKFDFSLVFYDVTTLYFETFKEDDFRKCGFSKDNKSNQPQILVALVVNKDGYPIKADLFEGNRFEGHTLLPVILNLRNKYNIANLTIVADAAMLKLNNLEELKKHNLNYIVAARLSNVPKNLLKEISGTLNRKEGIYFTKETDYGTLICDYSEKRAAKNKADRKKQLTKARYQIQSPGKSIRKLRFIRETTKSKYEINQILIEKDELLEGIKGYYTNLKNVDQNMIVSRYKDLWIIEKSFRIAKSDLEARPIFHRKKKNIEAHLLIVFISLCITKSIELKTNLSIKKIKDLIWNILDIELEDSLTGKKFIKRMDTSHLKWITNLFKLP